MVTRFQLRGASLEGIEWKIFSTHGNNARIVSAEKVTEGGIAGFFARHYFEAIVEIQDRPGPSPYNSREAPQSVSHPTPSRAGVAALLRDADTVEAAMYAAAQPQLSTTAGDFAAMLEELATTTAKHDPEAGGIIPYPLSVGGDAVMVVGVGADALTTARSMASALGSAIIRTAGSFRAEGAGHLVSRAALTSARATGVMTGQSVIVAFGLGADGAVQVPVLTDLQTDQVWIVVDARRKPADTAAWVRSVGWASQIDAVAVLHSQDTLTPDTVNDLGIPVGWVDGMKATRPKV